MVTERAGSAGSRHRQRPRPPALTPVGPSSDLTSTHGTRITVELTIVGPRVDVFYDLYLAAFAPLRTRAVARQVLNRGEFFDEMADPRVWKYVAWDDEGQPQALSTLTRHLETVPWISPEFFADRYPEHAARDAVYYLGFVLTKPGLGGHLVLRRLFSAMNDVLAADRAVCGYDICLFNNETIHFARQIERMARRLSDASTESVDTQTYYSTTWP